MRASVKLQPGQRGTKRYVEQYGDQLFCVRYRYDRAQRKRYTTVEIIVASADWMPKTAPEVLVGVQVAWGEAALAARIRAAGGQWNRARRVWELTYGQVCALELLDRLVWLDQ
ncbi:hypothetical protein K2Z83_17410 [Oscillochloris sp. ZM17-4]|uniref:hypothetical protein n=1 Tax=Oscillochloris sp. ZM17-4 TaxID=2866714 RepID=UPI001C733D30|nr:hypothetical protein [Oscillochloris sp. ZM17-4]MBX0329452.1 hypothetical protein [Oscillochloris sp. ZM17-4]